LTAYYFYDNFLIYITTKGGVKNMACKPKGTPCKTSKKTTKKKSKAKKKKK
jgi:hypothetical protein